MVRFVSIVSPDFWPGFAALVQSLAENSGFNPDTYEIVAITDPQLAPKEWLGLRNEKISLFPINNLPSITVLTPQSQGRRMEQALQKLAVFALPEHWGTCVYIDSDMVCLSPITALSRMQPLAAACDFLTGFDKVSDGSPENNSDINTGLMVFSPRATIFEELASVYRRRHSERSHKGDQDIINMWIRETGQTVHRLSSEWNFSKRLQDTTGVQWLKSHIEQIKILHFVGAKPWVSNREITTVRECRYQFLETIWWDYFHRSKFAEFMDRPPRRSTAFSRQWILPWSKPEILREHSARLVRFSRRLLPRFQAK